MPDREAGRFVRRLSGALLSGPEVPEKYQAGLRARQMASMSRLTDIILLSSALNMMAVVGLFWNSSNRVLLLCWAGFGLAVTMAGIRHHARYRLRSVQRPGSRRALRDFTQISVFMGIFWGIAPLLLLDTGNLHGQMLMAMICAGVMFAGGFLLSRLPSAAVLFMTPTAFGMSVAMFIHAGPSSLLMSVLLLYYLCVLLCGIFWIHRQFVEQYLSDAAVAEQAHLIGILIRDFEESSSDMLWQTDESGIVQDIPLITDRSAPSDAAKDGIPEGGIFLSIFREGEERRILESEINARRAFRDIVVPVHRDDAVECWWSLTGKPLYENDVFAGYRGVASDVTQAKKIEHRMLRMAHFDALTALPNRTSLQERLDSLVAKGSIQGQCQALLLMDLDNFKWVNDTLGHPAGDELLRQTADRMRSFCSPEDFFARLGGDEFALIVSRPDLASLSVFLDTMAARMGNPYDVWGTVVNCSASIGVRLLESGLDARRMISNCDLALYQAKRLGRARWFMFNQDLECEALERSDIQQGLGRALEKDELRLHFQPIMDSLSGEIHAFEALVRWQHPERGLIYPEAFIPHAEENGLIIRLGEWVIREAIAQASAFPESIRIAINISGVQIHSATLIETIRTSISMHGVEPSRIELEVSEAGIASNSDMALQRLHQLKEAGVGIVLDDFGKGSSTLRCLRIFPFDRVKIDCRQISDIEMDRAGLAIMQAGVQLAHSLGISCTAEGVETDRQAMCLREIGCDSLQGFFISPALPCAEAGHFLAPSNAGGSDSPAGARQILVKGVRRNAG